ncbi:oxygen-dependent coproporphyrinogen oxidase [Flavobacterium sp. ZT3R18]|uniref:oxygen-dependent coproporphyrinogen oxidase n=1 Tax=Flavobacterium sp. ZT3R18 TaxID=2594429 RepID=UPI00117B6E97|nr:oxygen-dependent coproporphyrinogen oxidase [Flavobacterium sp. ZT3R18]TRX32052.1 oxygen-dependent coproporphyrinogen oxidase [Flavobacterium sp. ZT3R18]
MKEQFYAYIQNLQDQICKGLEAVDGQAKFREDLWERPDTSAGLSTGGGGGRTRVIENGAVFEKGGVNISAVHGKLPEAMQKMFNVGEADFFACGLSLVLHPKNPMVPTVHANWRYFEMYDTSTSLSTSSTSLSTSSTSLSTEPRKVVQQWFGGGQDLTPYYLFEEDAVHFHQTCKTACDKHNPEFYPKYKKQCDAYFWNAHRNEARGIGGLFFDYCKENEDMSMQDWYNFVTEVGNSFLEAYVPIVEKRKDLPYTAENRTWQEIRRGRYVEFNLVHDKGTLFGLKTNGRIESILMSLPPHVQWVYDHHPEAGSEEEKLIKVLENPKEWL